MLRQTNTSFTIARQKALKAEEVFAMTGKPGKPENNTNQKNTAIDIAQEMGVELLTEEEYRSLQKLGKFDLKTSSWIKTPADIRELGGAVFVIAAIIQCFFTITEPIPIMLHGDLEGY